MLLASALLALSAAQAAPADVTEKEMLCVFDGLDNPTLAQLARLALGNDRDAGLAIVRIARPATEKCAATWKWGDRGRVAGALTAAAYAAEMWQDHVLGGRVGKTQLVAIVHKMSERDRFWLTFTGSQEFPAEQSRAFTDRFEALAKAEGIKPADYPDVAFSLK